MLRTFAAVALCLAFLAGCASVPVLTPEQSRAVHTRTIPVPARAVWDAAVARLQQVGYTFVQMDPNTGIILTDWRAVGDQIVERALAGMSTQAKVSVQILATAPNECIITTYITGAVRQNYESVPSTTTDVHPSKYDQWYDRIGERVGVVIPHVWTDEPQPEKGPPNIGPAWSQKDR